MPLGQYAMRRTSLDRESNVNLEFDWTNRKEIAAGATITSATMRVLLNDVASSGLTLGGVAVDNTGKKVQVRVTDAGTAPLYTEFSLVCDVTLSDGTGLLPQSITIAIVQA